MSPALASLGGVISQPLGSIVGGLAGGHDAAAHPTPPHLRAGSSSRRNVSPAAGKLGMTPGSPAFESAARSPCRGEPGASAFATVRSPGPLVGVSVEPAVDVGLAVSHMFADADAARPVAGGPPAVHGLERHAEV